VKKELADTREAAGKQVTTLSGAAGGGKKPPSPPAGTVPGDEGRPPIYFTVNAERAKKNFETIDRLDPAAIRKCFVENNDFSSVAFTPRRGDFSQMVVFVAKNVQEFQTKIAEAAKEKKLLNKQVALITCGDAFTTTAELRERSALGVGSNTAD
jgi:hypothetical protein